MKRVALFLSVLLSFVAMVGATQGSFEGIAFGTSREETKNALMNRLGIISVQAFAGVEHRGPDNLKLIEEDDLIILRGYRLKDRKLDVALFFNANGRFFRYQYEAQRRPGSYFESAIRDDANFLSRHFQKVYGSPTFQMNPKRMELRPGGRGFFWRWTKERDTVYTAIAAGDYDFGAIGVVSDDRLEREPLVLRPVENVPGSEESVLKEFSTGTFETTAPEPSPSPEPSPGIPFPEEAVAPSPVPGD